MKSKILIFLIITFIPVVSLCQSYHKLTHYNINNVSLTPYHIGGENFILAGTNGGILRTTNSGQDWEQTYSGTNNSFNIVRQFENDIFAITREGDLMKSENGGDIWNTKKISDSLLFDFYIDNGIFYVTQLKDSIMISSDNGNSWISEFVIKDSIQNIYVNNGKIILKTFRNGLLTKENGKWISFPLPLEIPSTVYFNVLIKDNGLYVIGNSYISKLNNDFEWNSYPINDQSVNDVLETNNQLITVNSNQNKERIEVSYYNKLNMLLEKTEMITDTNLSLHHFSVIGASINEQEDIIVTALGKTIFRKKHNSEWETKSAFIVLGVESFTFGKFYSKNEWRFTSSFGNYIMTNDGGTTFGKGTRTIEKLEKNNIQYVTKDSINFAVNNQEFNFASSSDAGKTFEFKNIESPFVNYNLFSIIKGLNVYNKLIYKNQSSYHPFTSFFKEENGVLDTLFELDSIFVSKYLNYKDKILIIEEQNEEYEFNFLLSDSDLKNPKKVYSLKVEYDKPDSRIPIIKNVFSDQNGTIFVMIDRWPKGTSFTYTSIYKITDFDSEPELVFEESPIYFYYPSNYSLDANNELVTIAKLNKDTTGLDFFYGKLDFSNGFDYEIVGENDVAFMTPEYTLDDGILLFQRSPYNIWRPIEPDRIPTTVETEAIPPAIWTYPPYPNPTNNRVSVSFYSGTMSQINELEVSLINISTGISTKMKPTNINVSNNWYGTIDLDLINTHSGSYLIEFRLNNKISVEKIIINR